MAVYCDLFPLDINSVDLYDSYLNSLLVACCLLTCCYEVLIFLVGLFLCCYS